MIFARLAAGRGAESREVPSHKIDVPCCTLSATIAPLTTDPKEATVHFILPDGESISVKDRVGRSVMDFAVDHGISGILSQCGGACICTMCHCYIDENWFDRIGPVSFDEKEMLEFVPERRATSRLACQVIVTPILDGLKVHIESE